MKNEKGMTFIMLVIMLVVIIALIGTVVFFLLQSVGEETFDKTRTNMLTIQGKVKVLSESSIAKKDEAIKKGTKVSENEEDEKIKSILEKGIISKEEEHYQEYYSLNTDNLNEMGLNAIELKDGNYVIVNYKTYEVIYTQGIKMNENEYFKLSELNKVKEDREIALNEQALEKETKQKETEEQPDESTEAEVPQEQPEVPTEPEQPAEPQQ